jgi:hypothetical protein
VPSDREYVPWFSGSDVRGQGSHKPRYCLILTISQGMTVGCNSSGFKSSILRFSNHLAVGLVFHFFRPDTRNMFNDGVLMIRYRAFGDIFGLSLSPPKVGIGSFNSFFWCGKRDHLEFRPSLIANPGPHIEWSITPDERALIGKEPRTKRCHLSRL